MSIFDTDLWDRKDYYDESFDETEDKEETPFFNMYERQDADHTEDDSVIEDLLQEEEISVVDNARIRLEQGRLYEMLIKHNLFEGVDAMPQAVAKVQTEIKEFIIERLEILLGMKSEKQEQNKEVRVINESHFNDLEIQALKMIASKVTKGASENTTNNSTAEKGLNTIKNMENKKNSLKSVKTPSPVVKNNKNVTQNRSPIPPAAVKKDKKINTNIDKNIISKSSDLPATAEDAAKKDIKYIESLKQMTLEDANKIVSQRHSRPKSTKTLSQESINRHYETKVSIDENAQTFTRLLRAAGKL